MTPFVPVLREIWRQHALKYLIMQVVFVRRKCSNCMIQRQNLRSSHVNDNNQSNRFVTHIILRMVQRQIMVSRSSQVCDVFLAKNKHVPPAKQLHLEYTYILEANGGFIKNFPSPQEKAEWVVYCRKQTGGAKGWNLSQLSPGSAWNSTEEKHVRLW